MALKFGSRYSPFYFYNIGGYFVTIGENSIFKTLDVILLRLEETLPRYRRKYLFAGFEIGYTAITVLFSELWRVFCVNWKYDS